MIIICFSDSSVNETIHTPSVCSESVTRESERVPKSTETKRVNFELQEDEEPFRKDPYNGQFYTRAEFYDYYGTHSIWKLVHPKRRFMRDTMWECVQYGTELNLSESLIKHLIMVSLKI